MSLGAIIDLGSTSSRLIIGSAQEVVARDAIITRMGSGLDPKMGLSDQTLARLRSALETFSSDIARHGADQVRVIATAAARELNDPEPLRALVEDVCHAELEIISGDEEGRLGFRGVSQAIDDSGPLAVVDIGGRSTEVIVGSAGDGVLGSLSMDTGAAKISDEFFELDPPGPEALSAALSVVGLHLDDLSREVPLAATVLESGTVIGVGGTITTAAAVEIGLVDYDRDVINGFELSKEAAEDVFRTLATETAADRAFNPGLQADRVDIIVGGMCMLVGLMRHFSVETLRVSEHDLLDGALSELFLV